MRVGCRQNGIVRGIEQEEAMAPFTAGQLRAGIAGTAPFGLLHGENTTGESTSTRTGSSVRLITWCAPAFPRGKQTTSPSRSSRSPSGVRSVGRPRMTIAHSSFP